jgi:GxxExxY protein
MELMDKLLCAELTEKVLGAAISVHRQLGPGLLENAYKFALMHELNERKIKYQTEIPIPMIYKGQKLDCGYRADLLVEDSLIVELKAAEHMHNLFKAQLMTYLRLSERKVGLLINFNTELLKNGVIRLVI